ncbi:GNAT family N-acetyltransferase [Vibrio tritonius]|uniref:GNAT family N-acetyltransferase n=1 Tax=Vibrio tritonius TaxID=1435069 RepID=A0ABS7YKS9_9VIBR|nr:GNAT family N-acetyltransferase [Vibrio tritonius]MCA2015672.1 GNAT family N-acetyltransferase [Vibrio tritonius]
MEATKTNIEWQCLSFEQLTTHQLYDILRLRVDVFIVEQNCPYHELDNKDRHPEVRHLLGIKNGEIVAYSRLLAPEVSFASPSIGRVITLAQARGNGLGHQLMTQAIQHTNRLWPNQPIEIEAQAHLQVFYEQHGFVKVSEPFMLDNIPHIEMIRDA